MHRQLNARGTATRWVVWTQWYGEEATSPIESVSDFLDTHENKALFSSAIHRWICDVEDLLLDPIELEDESIECFSGALAHATLREICGSWMLMYADGRLNLADVRIRAVEEDRPIDEQIKDWRRDEAQASIAPVRRILQAEGPQIDLATGTAVSAKFSVEAIVSLLNMSRRSSEFLTESREVTP